MIVVAPLSTFSLSLINKMEKYRAFVVEDDPDDWLFLKEAFEEVQCTNVLKHYSEPDTLLKELDALAADQYPHLIVLDNRTQGLNSHEVAERLRANTLYKDITIVVYTSALVPKMEEELLQSGVDLCLAKGHSAGELRGHVEQFCALIASRTA
jgi:CheY-like chemotaxis protein